MRNKITEADLEKWVINNLSVIEKGLTFVGRQIDLGDYGQLDLLCKDKGGQYVVVELKAPENRVDYSIISQTFRYRTGVQKKYEIHNPTRIRMLCYVHKIDPNVQNVCEQAGMGIVLYDIDEVNSIYLVDKSLPEKTTTGRVPKAEQKHAILAVRPHFFQRLDRFGWYDVKRSLKWVEQGSTIVFYSNKRLVAEARVLRVERKFATSKQLNRFLFYSGYLTKASPQLFSTVIFYTDFKKYDPPLSYESFREKFYKKKFAPIRHSKKISESELSWIRGKA